MSLKTIILILCLHLSFVSSLKSQNLEPDTPADLNGLLVEYTVVNHKETEVKKEVFERYEVLLSVKNNTGSAFNIRLSKHPDFTALERAGIAEFYCSNATGAKLTSKKASVNMHQHQVTYTYQTYDKKGKNISQTINITAGLYFDEGETLTQKVIFIVPKGEQPVIKANRLL